MKYEILAMLDNGGAIVNNSSVDGLASVSMESGIFRSQTWCDWIDEIRLPMQYADKGIRINAVCPRWIRTPPVSGMLAHNPDSEKGILMHQPIGRLGEPEEVAQAVVWLCSDKASLVVGTAMAVDGGYLIV